MSEPINSTRWATPQCGAMSGGTPITEHQTKPKEYVSGVWTHFEDYGRIHFDNGDKLDALEAFIEERGLVEDLKDWLPEHLENCGCDLDEYRREMED